eukprot:TRINITY_DN119_c0_g1_i1.p1 TRINITY_DN119_c0_g1~~TRINITY_DN119_c0_g1_i1.p1  ORF type:complete len:596 (+),score=173.16 TRINITY_DN119_c0_g1_i1:169-1956(+)
MREWRKCFDIVSGIFPEVDKRIIKAVALEHPEDIDNAVEFIINEVIPLQNHTFGMRELETSGGIDGLLESASDLPSVSVPSPFHSHTVVSSGSKDRRMDYGQAQSAEQNTVEVLKDGNLDPEKDLNKMIKYDDLSEERDGQLIKNLRPMGKEDNITVKCYISQSIKSSNQEYELSRNSCSRSTDVDAPLNAERCLESPVSSITGEDSLKSNSGTEADASVSCKRSHSYKHNVNREVLEDLVFNTKNRKENLAEALEATLFLKEVAESEEALARCANEEVAKAGLEIMEKLEDLRQMLSHAKEANDSRATEVSGERLILASEANELHCRLSHLAREEAQALVMIDEIQEKLKERIDSAKRERQLSEEERRKKEENAFKVLAMEEVLMEKVIQDSIDLETEAQVNAKLKDFLVDRGHIVDALQGEISALCKKITSLREQIDAGIVEVTDGLTNMKQSFLRTLGSAGVEALRVSLDGRMPWRSNSVSMSSASFDFSHKTGGSYENIHGSKMSAHDDKSITQESPFKINDGLFLTAAADPSCEHMSSFKDNKKPSISERETTLQRYEEPESQKNVMTDFDNEEWQMLKITADLNTSAES